MIVKSSLALSLGLVGALSIVDLDTNKDKFNLSVYRYWYWTWLWFRASNDYNNFIINNFISSLYMAFKNKVENILSYNLVITWNDQT